MGLYCPNDSSNSDGNCDLHCVSNCDRDSYSNHTTYAHSYCYCLGYGYGDCDGSTYGHTITVKSRFAFPHSYCDGPTHRFTNTIQSGFAYTCSSSP